MKLAADDLRDEVLGRLDEVVVLRRPIERRNPGTSGHSTSSVVHRSCRHGMRPHVDPSSDRFSRIARVREFCLAPATPGGGSCRERPGRRVWALSSQK